MANDVTRDASNSGFNYYGRWQHGTTAVTINSGAFVEFAYTGRECALVTYLQTIRKAYPSALIQAVCPHNVGRYAAAIQAAVAKMADPRIAFLDYSSGVIAPKETSDGCHLNRDGAVRLAARVTKDLKDRFEKEQ